MLHTSCRLILFSSLTAFLCVGVPQAWAGSASSTTTLTMTSGSQTVAAGGSVSAGSEVTLTAAVISGSTTVTTGRVNFCDASATYCTDIHLLGTAQVIQSGPSAGTAVFRFHPGIGSHSYRAVFAGTPNGATPIEGSTSSTVTLTVSGTFPTTTAIAASGSVGNYMLTATVTGTGGTVAPTGTVSFLDTTNNNLSLGSATLGAGTIALGFLNSSTPSTNPYPQSIAVADFNSDGKLDMAVPVYSISTPLSDVTILLGNGDGTFTEGPATPATGQNANNAAVADFNSDGNADIAVSLPDANQVQVLLGNGDGTFTALSPISVNEPYSVATADLNGDGRPDLIAVICASESLEILLGNGDGTFTQKSAPNVGGCPSSVTVGDFNGDGIPDLAVALNTNATGVSSVVAILIGNGDGTFTQKTESPAVGDNPLSIATGDFNGDGILDLAVANSFVDSGQPGTVTVLLGKGDGTFTPTAVSPAVGVLPYSVAVGDVNGDGKADLVTANVGSNTFSVLLGNGDGTFAAPLSPAAGTDPISGVVADFNGDGLADLAAADNYPNYMVTVQLSQSTQTAMAVATGISPSGSGTHQVEANYPGDGFYGSSISTTVGLTATTPPSFAVTGTAVSVAPGATTGNASTISITPAGGFTGSVALTASITSSPNGAVSVPTLSFGTSTPVAITSAGAGTATLTAATVASSSPCTSSSSSSRPSPWYAGGSAVLACLLFFGIPARLRSWRNVLGMLTLLIAFTFSAVACGGASTSTCNVTGPPSTTAGNYTITVTGTSGSLTETGTITLTVQ
jgi:FG-GAP-like repeat/Bacterial Ig-like domain (group 3)